MNHPNTPSTQVSGGLNAVEGIARMSLEGANVSFFTMPGRQQLIGMSWG